MNISYLIYLAVLFFLLVPGVLVTLPKGGSKMVVAATHALVFIVVFVLTKKIYQMISRKLEGLKTKENESESKAKKPTRKSNPTKKSMK